MKNSGLILGITIFAAMTVGGIVWWKSSQSKEDKTKEDKTGGEDKLKDSDPTPAGTTAPVKTDISVTTTPMHDGRPPAPSVYANSKGVKIALSTQGTTPENPIVLGKVIRTTESKGEVLGSYTKIVTIFSIPYVLFTDSYSGRKVLIAKSAVTVK